MQILNIEIHEMAKVGIKEIFRSIMVAMELAKEAKTFGFPINFKLAKDKGND